VPVDEVETIQLLKAADIVTKARTAVEYDYRGEVIIAHAPEMPTRFAKQLAQMVRGGVAIGMTRKEAVRLALRCARDSMPPLRLEILLDLAANPDSQVGEVRQRIDKPWTTTKREMEALHMLGMVVCEEFQEEEGEGEEKTKKTKWIYNLADGFDENTLLAMKFPTWESDENDPIDRLLMEHAGEGVEPVERWRRRSTTTPPQPSPEM
jgi:hypothetical protein